MKIYESLIRVNGSSYKLGSVYIYNYNNLLNLLQLNRYILKMVKK